MMKNTNYPSVATSTPHPVTTVGGCKCSPMRFLNSVLPFPTVVVFLALLPAPTQAQTDVCSLLVLKASKSTHYQPENLVINNDADWQSLWEGMFINTSPKPPLPQIDFTRRTIIAVFQGLQAGSGYEISIEGILETESSLEVSVKAFEPGERCAILGVITEPFYIVEVSKIQKNVVFHVKHKLRKCG